MATEIYTKDYSKLSYGGTGDERVIRNVLNILRTRRYEVPYNRTMGIDDSVLERPLDEVKALLASDAMKNIMRYEPRANVKSIEFDCFEGDEVHYKVVLE